LLVIDQTLIIETGLSALANIVESVEAIDQLLPDDCRSSGPPFSIISNGEIPTRIEDICSFQALAFGCLFDKGHRHTESAAFKNHRLKRVAEVQQRCGANEIPELRNRGVRNALAHFDERMLKALAASPNCGLVQDLAVSHREAIAFEPTTILVRFYCYDIDTLFLFNETLHLQPLKGEAQKVLAFWPEWLAQRERMLGRSLPI
jgi:hypothetical protein